MSTDYGEKEREFLDELQADTGRSLPAWMEAISAQGLADKNDIIDWLRQQGFMFWKASWLERIHANGGRPVYGEAPVAAPEPSSPQAPVAAPGPEPAAAAPMPPADSPAAPAADAALEELLARAKALRPLARHILKEIARTVPGAGAREDGGHVSIRLSREFAVLAVSPRELRLGLALPGREAAVPLVAARFPAPAYRVSPAITHMIALTDARQIDAPLLAAVVRAARTAGE
jgi:hypothetical protein